MFGICLSYGTCFLFIIFISLDFLHKLFFEAQHIEREQIRRWKEIIGLFKPTSHVHQVGAELILVRYDSDTRPL